MSAAHPVPLSCLDGKLGILGVTGSGKTFTAIGLVEILLTMGRQVIIIDPTGAYHGLRAAFPIFIFGGPNGDHPITESDGPSVASAIVQLGMSAIIDVSLLLKESHGSARRFMAGLVKTLKNSPAAARYVVVDEADEFMPENASGAAAGLMGDFKWMVRRGRKDGWRVMMVTQRPQDVAKSVLTQCETLVIHKLVAPQDRKALQEWVKGNADEGEAKKVLESLARLETGEAWVWSTSHGILDRVRIPANRSADSSKTPDAEDDVLSPANFQPVDVSRVVELLGGTGGAAESTPAADPALLADNQRLRARVAELEGALEDDLALMGRWSASIARLRSFVDNEFGSERGERSVEPAEEGRSSASPLPAEARRVPPAAEERRLAPVPAPAAPTDGIWTRNALDPEAPAPKGRALQVLNVLVEFMSQHPAARQKGVKEKTWAFLTGTKRDSSTWRGYKAALRGYFAQNGDRVIPTEAAEALFPPLDGSPRGAVQTGEYLVRQFIAGMKPAGAAKILEELLEAWPESRTRAQLAAATDAPMASSTFRGYLAPLNNLELIEKDGQDFRLATDLMEW